jgi:hypothetical protein
MLKSPSPALPVDGEGAKIYQSVEVKFSLPSAGGGQGEGKLGPDRELDSRSAQRRHFAKL